jgi:hypothetical protein
MASIKNPPAQLLYQVSPIFLSGGLIGNQPGAVLPLLWLTGRLGDASHPFSYNVLNVLDLPPLPAIDLDNAFGAFTVLPGGTLVSQQVGKYPFANQFVAANATIREPLTVSLVMDAPWRGPNAYANKFAVMTALKMTLDAHNNLGGTYTVCTPAYMYTNMLLTNFGDASRSQSPVPQNSWRWDFERPLVALEELQMAYANNLLMAKLANGLPTAPVVTGIQIGIGVGQGNLLLPSLLEGYLSGQLASTAITPGGAPTSVAGPSPG